MTPDWTTLDLAVLLTLFLGLLTFLAYASDRISAHGPWADEGWNGVERRRG